MTMTGSETASSGERAGAVAHSAAEAGKQVAGTLSERTADVADTARAEIRTVAGKARTELRSQAEQQGRQAIDGLRTLSHQISALSSGRPEEAGQLGSVLSDAQQRLQSYVGSLEARGPQGMIDDVTRFARRRPGVFLLGAAAAGFAVGRLVRAGASVADSGEPSERRSTAAMTGTPSMTHTPSMTVRPSTASGGIPEAADIPLDAPDPSARVIRP